MLTIKQALQIKPVFILAVNYDANLGDMMGEDTSSEYLAEMTIQYHSLLDNACLAFYVECLVSVNDNKVTIEQMDTCSDMQAVYSNNIQELPNDNHNVWSHDIDEELHNTLLNLIESQPIDDIPAHYIIEAY